MATFLIRCNLKMMIFIHKKSQIVKLFIHCGAHMLSNNFEENHVLLLKCDEFMDVNLALDGV